MRAGRDHNRPIRIIYIRHTTSEELNSQRPNRLGGLLDQVRRRGSLDAVILLIIRNDKIGLTGRLVNNAPLAVFIGGHDVGDPVA